MRYTPVSLKEKIMELYPEIGEQNLSPGLFFDETKNAYIVTISSEGDVMTTHLTPEDADACMNGNKCVHLGLQVGQAIKNIRERKRFALNAA